MIKYFIKNTNPNNKFGPDYFASSVLDINFKQLYDAGVRCIAFDVDGTITESASLYIDRKLAHELAILIQESGINNCILASNSTRKMDDILNELKGFKTVQPHSHKPKPTKEFYWHVIKSAGYSPNEIAMVGDRYLQDIWGAKRSGLKTVLVAMKPEHASNIDRLIFRHYWQKKSVLIWARFSSKK